MEQLAISTMVKKNEENHTLYVGETLTVEAMATARLNHDDWSVAAGDCLDAEVTSCSHDANDERRPFIGDLYEKP